MKVLVRLLVVLALFLALASFATTYTVRFTEQAVVTTFGRAGEDSIKDRPGLGFKLPAPFQSVTKYDTRARVLVARSSTQQTDDDAQVVVEAFAVWKVDDALEFFQKFSNAGNRAELHYEAAEDILESALRSATGETSQFRLDELFSPTPGATRLPELERRVLAALEESVRPEGEDGGFGIAVEMVGINRITLDENTTETVMDRMVATRDRLASELRKQGESQATTIEAQAERDAATILAFASRRAAQIESLGQREASEFLAPQNEVAELAVFLAKLETLSSTMAEQFTVVLSENDFGFSLLAPSAVGATQGAGFPGRSFGDTIAPLRLGLNPGGPAPEDGSDD